MSEVVTPNTYTPSKSESEQARTLASDVRTKTNAARKSWVLFCQYIGGIRAKYTNAGVKSDVFYAWCLDETGFAKATVADGILYAETLPTLPAGSEKLDKSWVTTLAKADPKDRAAILAKVESMPAKVKDPKTGTRVPTAAKHRKDLLQTLAAKSAAKANPEKARNAEVRKSERAKSVEVEKLENAVKTMPRVLKAALLAGQGYAVIMAAVEYGQQHGESAILAVEKVHAERPKADPKAAKTTPDKVAA